MAKLKSYLGWSTFVLVAGYFSFLMIRSMYREELRHHATPTTAAIMTFLLLVALLVGCWLGNKFTKRLKEAVIYAALHPYVPKPPKARK